MMNELKDLEGIRVELEELMNDWEEATSEARGFSFSGVAQEIKVASIDIHYMEKLKPIMERLQGLCKEMDRALDEK